MPDPGVGDLMDESLFAAAQALLESITDTADMVRVLDREAEQIVIGLTAQLELAKQANDPDRFVQVTRFLGWLHWYRFSVLPPEQREEELETALRLLEPAFFAATEPESAAPVALMPLLARRA